MKVLFVRSVPDVAGVGEVKDVADGYARNFLLPQKLAVAATPKEIAGLKERQESLLKAQARELAEAKDLARRLGEMMVTIKARVGAQDRLYGSITRADIAKELQRSHGQTIDRRKIALEEPIKSLGEHKVPIRLAPEVVAEVRVLIEGTEA